MLGKPMFEKMETSLWEPQKFCYKSHDKNNDSLFFRHSRSYNRVTKFLARQTIFNKLFDEEGRICSILLDILANKQALGFNIVLVTREKTATDRGFIAVGIVLYGVIHIYVKPEHRRSGIGSQIINFLRFKKVHISKCYEGEEGSIQFYQHNKVTTQ